MELSSLILTLLAVLIILLAICGIYFYLYKRHINLVLTDPEKKHRKMIPPYQILLVLTIITLIVGTSFFVTLLPNIDRISTINDIEQDVRRKTEPDWTIDIAMNSQVAAVLAYSEQQDEHTFSIYQNKGKVNTNYVFRHGGKSTAVERGIRIFHYEGATALVSMNALHLSALECHDGERYELDPQQPFVLVIPNGGFNLYDSNGVLIDLSQIQWVEQT